MSLMSKSWKVAIIGASGYSGAELVGLLLKHPFVSLSTLMSVNQERQASRSGNYGEELPQFYQRCDLEIEPLDLQILTARQIAVVFLATPNETSHELVPQLLERNLKVVDLSGAYRLKDASLYPKWYGFEHRFPALLERAVYGLTELNRDGIRQARLLANPGCYPTSVLLPLLPLRRSGLIDPGCDVVCDSKSGVTGAGKSPTANTHFSEVTESFKAYNVFKHRHAPEIWQELASTSLVFTPHLLPLNRGILSTIYVRVQSSVSEGTITECFQEAYGDEPFVRLFPRGALPEIKFTAHTNYCDIGWRFDSSRSMLVIVSVIDNLVKGAAGQALQNMNIMLGVEETAGLV
jgi:N-acetyl-gamma-glutamyl-phosphate reductase